METKINDGGRAFPTDHEDGMSKRDYFAAAAMQGLLASGRMHLSHDSVAIAERARDVADAMIKTMAAPVRP